MIIKHCLLVIFLLFGLMSTSTAQQNNTIKIGCKVDPELYAERVISKQLNYNDGFDIELINMLCSELDNSGINYEFIIIDSKDRIKSLEEGTVDIVISTLSITEERKHRIDYSLPYAENPGLALVSNINGKYSYMNDILNEQTTISVVQNSTASTTIKKYKNNKKKSFIVKECANFGEAINELKNTLVDAHLDDFNNLLYLDSSDPDLEIVGFFPAENQQAADLYAIGVKKGNDDLKLFLDNFLNSKRKELSALNDKWFNIPNKNILFRLRNLRPIPSDMEKFFTRWAPLILSSIVIITIVIVYIITLNTKKRTGKLEQKLDESEKIIREQFNSIKEKLSLSSLGEKEIVTNGSKFFSTCEDLIYYVGAGGFVSDVHSDHWRDAIRVCLTERKKRMVRIVDLPPVEEAAKLFSEEELVNYLKWLLIQAFELQTNPTKLELFNSRGAPLWGHGFIIMIKDTTEMMLFTGGANKTGYLISIEPLVDNFCKTTKNLIYQGKSLGCQDIIKYYFPNSQEIHQALEKLKISQNKDTMLEVTEICRKYVKQKKFYS